VQGVLRVKILGVERVLMGPRPGDGLVWFKNGVLVWVHWDGHIDDGSMAIDLIVIPLEW
jgi:hypothetical protein